MAALAVLRPVFDASGGTDGFVSVEVAADLARDTQATLAAARTLHERIAAPNLYVKIPATAEGVPAIQGMIADGRNINITLIFSLARYGQVIEAYLSGLETLVERGGDPSTVHSVASFFVSRVDTEVDARLEKAGTPEALALRGEAAIAQAKLAYLMFRERFSGPRWQRLADHDAHDLGWKPPARSPRQIRMVGTASSEATGRTAQQLLYGARMPQALPLFGASDAWITPPAVVSGCALLFTVGSF